MAERNTGAFKDAFITFSGNPRLELLKGNTLRERVINLTKADWAMNTDINAVFDLILKRGKTCQVPPEEMPATIYIISDMQFDACTKPETTNFESIKRAYAKSGYTMPRLVFWNVNARHVQTPVSANEQGVVLVSGCSPVIFDSVFKALQTTPYGLMLEVINQPRYDVVK
jgi:hypothetical protein